MSVITNGTLASDISNPSFWLQEKFVFEIHYIAHYLKTIQFYVLWKSKLVVFLQIKNGIFSITETTKKQDVGKAAFPSGGSPGESVSLPFPASRSCLHSMTSCPLHPSSKSFSNCISLVLSRLERCMSFKTHN